MRSLLAAGILLLATSCVDQANTPEPTESQDSQAVAVDLTTRPWTPRLAGQYNYWPTDAVRVQVIEINGDVDPASGLEYSYVYMVKNGSTIFQLFRLVKDDIPSLNSTIGNVAHATQLRNPASSLQNVTAGFATGGPHPPPQPGGTGAVTRAWFNQIILDQAAAMNNVMTVINANMNTPNYRQNLATPPGAGTTGPTAGIAAP